MSSSEKTWLTFFVTTDYLNRIANGIFITLIGPSQPYLAKAANVEIDTITLLWTFGGLIGILSSIYTAKIFKAQVKSSLAKMSWISFWTVVMVLSTALFPMSKSFPLMLILFSIRFLAMQAWETAGMSMYVYTLGPIRSRTLVMGYHFIIGIGFLLGPNLIKHFLPEMTKESSKSVCNKDDDKDLSTILDPKADIEHIISHITWAYMIVASIHSLCAVGYMVTAKLSTPMPVYVETNGQEKLTKSEEPETSLKLRILIMSFFMISCGCERIFQTFDFTFGLCGPLKLTPNEAVFTDTCYNGGFLLGRISSMLVVAHMAPKKMLKYSVIICLISAVTIAVKAADSAVILYSCAMFFGLSVSWQFGSAYSWIAENIDVLGSNASLFLVGCTLGGMITPVGAGFLFKRVAQMSVWYLNLLCCIVQYGIFMKLNWIFAEENKLGSSIRSF